MDRIPFQATTPARAYESISRLPVSLVLDNVRSLYNTGSFFRTADACAVERLILCGITPRPAQGQKQKNGISKTALGAEETVAWEYAQDAVPAVSRFARDGYQTAAIETSSHAVDLFDWEPAWPVCLVFGHEVDGVSPGVSRKCDTHIRIPMLGRKHSLNVATAAGVVLYELLRKYRIRREGSL